MGIQIEDGKGSGQNAGIKDNRLNVSSRINSRMYYVSRDDGIAFTWSNTTYDYDALDTILLVKNTSSTKKLVIERISVGGSTATEVIIHCPTCTTPTGTSITGTNTNRTSANVAEATAISDETTNTQSNKITSVKINGSNSGFLNVNGAIILGQNDCIAIDFVTDGTACYATIQGYYE